MRQNLPVTAIEYQMEEGRPIVSKTDLKGKITYVNPYFAEVSGFSQEELLGAPHNLVRHPDMPEAAFADLWATLKAGQSWTGMVKNRRKNGDFYWVLANVTPVLENGRATGYMSVRTRPGRQQIEEADRLYRAIAAGSAGNVALKQGRVVKTGFAGKLAGLRTLSIRARINTGLVAFSAMFLLMGGIGVSQLNGAAAGWMGGLAGLGLAFTLLQAYAFQKAVGAPLHHALEAARTLAGGDLTSDIDTSRGDDMGQMLRALQQMNVNLRAIVGDVRSNVESMRAATGDIAAGNMNLSQRTESQASSLEQTAASMDQFSSTVKQNAEHARQASQLVVSTTEVATRGGDSVARVGATMSDISASAHKIVDIISLIDGIAFQTNILALNAAVEAARAGEQGRGFAVVASEVRNLAQRSAAAAREIKGLIDDSVKQVTLGDKLVGEAGQTMSEIIGSVQRVAGIMTEIAGASQEQTGGIAQVNRAVSEMDQGTQQNAALVEEAAAAAASLDEQAAQLALAVSMFQVRRR
ncbi:methyl-accepting chemotaxis protein [Pseudoduganella namucuonensis]|uniref:Methyl-accepting chemotaxis sensory transducer with Pas/Pac sensor n=1 Tax=Pseudoduganella namucuonensis TaxID=1035707 RepID=A0A1I7LDU7_9BURK|nr:PAS domain-containing methyl-accepting chemotaxis protein [Pseudoduganella namucuonensis]SFV07756.1 methyl-accepting chemotaxis sensory transducer with Pas/Pac sensor [Pseudoduganella namucuonensis]